MVILYILSGNIPNIFWIRKPHQPVARRDQCGALFEAQSQRPSAWRVALELRLWPEPNALGMGGGRGDCAV